MGNNFICPCAVSDVHCYDLCITICTVAARKFKTYFVSVSKMTKGQR